MRRGPAHAGSRACSQISASRTDQCPEMKGDRLVRFLDYMSAGRGRAIRIAVGLVMIGLGVATGGPLSVLAVAGLLPLATGVFNICPISPIFGRSCRGNACRKR